MKLTLLMGSSKNSKLVLTSFFVVVLILSVSCTSQINGVLRQGGSADLTVQAALSPGMSALIRSLNAVMGNLASVQILDGAAISRSIAASPGVGSASLANTSPSAVEGSIAVSKIGDFLSSGRGITPFIIYAENSGTRPSGNIHITLDRENVPSLMAMLSPEAIDYLTALMAPVILEDYMSKTEYLLLVSSLYGRTVADEISAARIHAVIDFPGPITAIRGGTASGVRATFDISLLDLLVLETPLSWEVDW